MSFDGRVCLVTGAGGFIGSHLVEALVREGAQTRAFVHYSGGGGRGWLDRSEVSGEVEFFAGDVADRDTLVPAMRGADVVFHLAALIAIPYSYVAPESYVRTNVLGTLNVIQAARDAGVSRVVHTSTSEVYGTALSVPIREDHPLQGQSPYSASKIGADKMAEAAHLSFEAPVVTVRPFNTYGPRQSTRAVIPTIITQCLAGASAIHLGSTHPTRDFNFVADTVRGFLLAGTAPEAVGSTVNLATGEEISIGALVETIADLTGADITVVSDETRLRPERSEVDRLLGDASLARELMGWSSEHSLREGLSRTIDWFRENLGSYRTDGYHV